MGYLDLLQTLDAWFSDGVAAAGPGVVPCRSGCSACCHGPFDISAADAREVARGVATLPEPVAAGIIIRAAAQLRAGRDAVPQWQAPWRPVDAGEEAFDAMCDALEVSPCPALDPATGACLVHSHRPATCRLTGLALSTPDGDLLENVCPIQGEFPEYLVLAATPFDLMRFELAAAEHDLEAMDEGWHSTTVAGAVERLKAEKLKS
jgi:Fe-S-cluster containining protein